MHRRVHLGVALFCGLALAACDRESPTDYQSAAIEPTDPDLFVSGPGFPQSAYDYAGTVITVAGAGDLTASLATLRSLLGEPLNNTPGPHPGGRREINWDGVPAALTNTNDFPGDFFNSTDPAAPNGRKRGAVFTTAGSGFRISDNDFSDVDPSYASQFRFFSPVRTFIQIGARAMTVHFRLPGTDIPAVVNGFGVVFSDVDRLSSGLIFYDQDDKQIAIAPAPNRQDANGHSLVGAVFDAPVVAKVVIVSGDRSIGPGVKDLSSGGRRDLVVTDDFLYGEPQPIQ